MLLTNPAASNAVLLTQMHNHSIVQQQGRKHMCMRAVLMQCCAEPTTACQTVLLLCCRICAPLMVSLCPDQPHLDASVQE
jgi:hypothetical protein